MESLTTFTKDGVTYEIILKRRSGHWIMLQIDSSTSKQQSMYPWVLRYPDGEMRRFKSEYDLWKYALIEKKLF